MKKIILIVFCVLLLAGCEEQRVAETPEPEIVVEEVTETVDEKTPEPDLGVSDAVLTELENATKAPRYANDKKISDGYTREDYASVTKIDDSDDKFYTYEIVMKDGEKNRVSFRNFLIDE